MPYIHSIRIRPATILVALAVAVGAWLAPAGKAHAAGQIFYDGCLANDASQNCFDLSAEPLDGATATAVSPDGKSVYVASSSSDSVAHFFRSTSGGQISYDGCVANDGTQGCADLPGEPLDGANGVAVSPDGKSVYVTSSSSDSVAHFFRSTSGGQISYDGCVANDASQGCFDLPAAPLSEARGVAVSPDGESVYVASGSSVAHFFRSTSGGQISYDGCLANDASQGCFDLPAAPLSEARGVAVSPDGKSVYVASVVSASVAHFFRSTSGGQISYDGCVANDASQGCADVPAAPLDGASDVAVSPDGKSVYVASFGSGSVAHFFRSTTGGQIVYDGCLANDASQSCFDLPAAPLGLASDVAVSPDGKSVYVASSSSDSVAHFFRGGPDGQISYDGCVANDASQGCADVPAAPLDGASDVAVSPDGESVYVASTSSDSVAHFFRAVDPPPTPDPDPDPTPQPQPGPGPNPQSQPGSGADTSPPETTIVRGPKRRTARRTARFRFRASEPGVRFECRLDRRRWKSCSSPRTLKRLRVGRHRFAVRAVDAAGNVDPTPAKRRWQIVK